MTKPVIQEPAIADTSSNVTPTQEITPPAPITPQAPITTDTTAPTQAQTPEPAKQDPKSLLEKVSEQVKEEQKYWQDDWREKMADGDEKALKELQKHKSPNEAIRAYRELQKQFSKTRPLPQLAKDATAEQVAEYRENAGIPESWDKYDTNLDNGIVIGENHKEIVDKFLQKAHENNLRPDEVKKSLQTYFEISNTEESAKIAAAETQQAEIEKSLQKEWGAQYKDNLNVVATHLERSLGSEELSKLNQATLPDGTFLINNPKILNHFLKQAKSEMGGNTIVPTSAADFTSLADRKKSLEKMHAEDPRAFFNNPDLRRELSEISTTLSKKSR